MQRKIRPCYLFPLLLLSACSGAKSTVPAAKAKATISGVASAGPIDAGTVTAYVLNSDGTQGVQLGITSTDTKGNFQLVMNSPTTPLMLVVSGGSYVEEASGSTISLGNAKIRTALAAVSDGQKVGVTPLTEIATQGALANINANSTASMAAIINTSNAKVASAMGLADITLPPADPTVAAIQASNAKAAQYAIVLASLSQMAKSAATSNSTAINSLDMMQALATTFTYNGNFNSQVGGTNVPVPNAANATISLGAVLGGINSFDTAMQTAKTTVVASMPTGFNDSTIVPPVVFTTIPVPPTDAPTLSAPTPPSTLPSAEPTVGGPPTLPISTPTHTTPNPTPTPTPTPTPIPLTPVSGTWQTSTQVGGATADFGTLAYAPGGRAIVGYSVINGANVTQNAVYDLYTAMQTSNTTFATPVLVEIGTNHTNKGGGIYGSFFFASASTIWLASQSDFLLNIYKSVDSGSSWVYQNLYGNSDRDQSFNHSLWVDRGNGNLTLYFGYEYFNPVLNSGPLLSFANLTNGTWDASLTQTNLPEDPRTLLQTGSTILFPDGGVATSTDNAANFSHNWSASAKELHKIGTTIYANSFDGLLKSTDSGATWTKVFSGNLNGRFAGNDSFLVVVSGENTYQLSYTASADGGVTWTPPVVLMDYTSSAYNISSIQVAPSSNGHIGLVYSIQSYNGNFGPGSPGKGVFFREFY